MISSSRIGLVRCEHCNRQFNPHSAARHIPWCAKQQSARNRNRLSDEKREALERYKWRIGYRPSNHLQQYNHRGSYGQGAKASLVHLKKSSINSSSASSSASLTSSKTGRDSSFRRPQPQAINSSLSSSSSLGARQLGHLQRSVSSLTLTKQPAGGWAPTPGETAASGARNNSQVKRTKSVSDVNCIVESLARRVEEIYAQNQMLLAAMSMGNLSLKPNANSTRGAASSKQDSEDESETSQVKCHHCKTNCLVAANYCHKCGCKLRCPSGSTSPG